MKWEKGKSSKGKTKNENLPKLNLDLREICIGKFVTPDLVLISISHLLSYVNLFWWKNKQIAANELYCYNSHYKR